MGFGGARRGLEWFWRGLGGGLAGVWSGLDRCLVGVLLRSPVPGRYYGLSVRCFMDGHCAHMWGAAWFVACPYAHIHGPNAPRQGKTRVGMCINGHGPLTELLASGPC